MKFVKYVSANAPGSRWDIALEYKIEVSLGDDDEEEDNNDSSNNDTS